VSGKTARLEKLQERVREAEKAEAVLRQILQRPEHERHARLALCVDGLERIARNDRTQYEHHEARPSDGKKPSEEGGTCWLTPAQIARKALEGLEVK